MISVSIPDSAFRAPDWQDWVTAAKKELGKPEAINNLKFLNGGLEINPFYSERPLGGENFALAPASDPHLGVRAWVNLPKVEVKSPRLANEQALYLLNAGADGILFEMTPNNFHLNDLLQGIFWEQCPVSFLMNNTATQTLDDLLQFAEKNFPVSELTGSVFWKVLPEGAAEWAKPFQRWKKFYPLGLVIKPQGDAVAEVAEALSDAVKTIEHFSANGIRPEITLDQVAFSLSAEADFFITIAKLKALRYLWWQVRGAYGLKHRKPLHIHVTSTPLLKETYQPHGNMIKSTLAGIAAVAGGCDSLTIEPENDNNTTMARIARNVSAILRDEANLSKTADPTIGSYFLDSLIYQLAEKAWRQFQTKQSA